MEMKTTSLDSNKGIPVLLQNETPSLHKIHVGI